MGRPDSDYSAPARRRRTIFAASYLTYGMVAARELAGRADGDNLLVAAALLGAILALMVTVTFIFSWFPRYGLVYFVLQILLIQALGLLPPYQDIWGALYIAVSIQARYYLSFGAAITWGAAASIFVILTLVITIDPLVGLGLGLTYVAGSVLLVSWDVFSGEAERSHQESRALLDDLQQAHHQLEGYAVQVEEQATIRERDRLARELHDSVGQTLFGIGLTTESVRLLLDKDPKSVPDQLDRLQEMTGSALSQMRSLITQWRPK